MKNHPGHFWICFWLFLIFMNTINKDAQIAVRRSADALDRIETKLGRMNP